MSAELLEKIDQIRARFPVSYESAKNALEETGGDLIEALILLEEGTEQRESGEFLNRVKYLWRQGNKTKLRIKKDDRVLVEIPATMGAIGAILSPRWTFAGTVAALAGKCQIEVNDLTEEEKQQPSQIDSFS